MTATRSRLRYQLSAPIPPHKGEALQRLSSGVRARLGIPQDPSLQPNRLSVALVGCVDGVDDTRIAERAGYAIRSVDVKAFDLYFDRVGSFPGRVRNLPILLHAGKGAVEALKLVVALAEAMRGAGFAMRPPGRPFITLGYAHTEFPVQPIPPFSVRISEVALTCSHLGEKRTETVARWPLR